MAAAPVVDPSPRRSSRPWLVRRDSGLYGYELALGRAGLAPVAGADEAGRGACAGPLVAAAVVLPPDRRLRIGGLRDSKLMTPAARDDAYTEIRRTALAWSVVIVGSTECDRLGMHVANVQALRRAVLRLDIRPQFAITDGFRVDGLGLPSLAMWKGDRVAACVAAASVIAKVTRDRLMTEMDDSYPQFGFAGHKGYCTAEHQAALEQHGPCPEHRRRFDNVVAAERRARVASR